MALGNILFINLNIKTLVLCKIILFKGNNLKLKKIGAVWAKKAEKVIILTIFFCTKNSGCKSLSPAWPQIFTQYIRYGYTNE